MTGSKWLNSQSFLSIAKHQWITKSQMIGLHIMKIIFNQIIGKRTEKDKTTGLYNSGSIHFALKDILLKKHLHELQAYNK